MASSPRVKVGKHERNPTHDISLYDGVRTFGFRLDGGPGALVENPAQASTLAAGGGQGEYGDGDPHFRNVEQTDWRDGAGQEKHNSLAAGFADSMNAFTMLENKLIPAPQWKFSTGYKVAPMLQPGNLTWYVLHSGTHRYISQTFTPSANLTADKAYIHVRRIGDPGTLTLSLTSNSGGSPSTVLKTATLTTSTAVDFISLFQAFDWTTTEALTGSTVYHLKVSAASTDNDASHWEIGVSYDTSTAKYSDNDSSWSAADFSIFHRVVGADVAKKYEDFELLGGRYVCEIFDNTGTASKVWLQGIRGEATSVTATTTTDSAIAMTTDEYVGCTLLIVEGPGIGEYRAITANSADTFTHAAFDTTLTTASNFVVLGSTKWTEVATTGLGAVKNVVVMNDIAYFSQGESVNVRKMGWSSTTKAHVFEDDGSNKASWLLPYQHPVDGPQMWRISNKTSGAVSVSRATGVTTFTSDLSYGTAITTGAIDGKGVFLNIYDNSLWVYRNDQPFTVNNDKATAAAEQMKFIPHDTNGLGAVVHDVMNFIPWAGFTLQQFYGGSLNDVTRKRMPSNRSGAYTSGVSHPAGLFEGIDAGLTGTSSVQFRNDDRLGWHEIFRAWESGQRIRSIWWENNLLMRPKLWISVGNDLVYQEWPMGTLNPLMDSSMNYQHEAVVEMATIDLNAVSLPKYIEELRLVSKNLTTKIRVIAEYRLDDKVDVPVSASDATTRWINIGEFYISPEQTLKVDEGDVRQVKFRLRLLTNDSDVPPIVDGVSIKGVSRLPTKRYWTIRCTVADKQRTQRGQRDFKPIDIINWLKSTEARAQQLNIRSRWEDLDNMTVMLEPYTLRREYVTRQGKRGDVIWITVREA